MSLKIIGFILLTFVLLFGIFYYNFKVEKSLQLIWPNGGEEIRAGSIIPIKWRSKKIEKVDLFLIKEGDQKKFLIAEKIDAKSGKYNWKILAWQEPRQDYKILIVETNKKENYLFDYSDKIFTILGPKFLACDQLSIDNHAPFISGNYPGIKRLFITSGTYEGNFGGLENADQICQEEAKKRELEGNWKALLGDENTSARERLNLEGIFVDAEGTEIIGDTIPDYFPDSFENFIIKNFSASSKKDLYLKSWNSVKSVFREFLKRWNITEERKMCYRLLGKDFEELKGKLQGTPEGVKYFFSENFAKRINGGIWWGRVEPEEKKECIQIFTRTGSSSSRYSFTTTCGNWNYNRHTTTEELYCYDSAGNKIKADALGARVLQFSPDLSRGERFNVNFGQFCDEKLHLICIEQ